MVEETDADRQLRLVRKAIFCDTSGCFEFDDRTLARVRDDPFFDGIEPHQLKKEIADFVRAGGRIVQRQERDEEWRCRRRFDFWYSVCFRIDGLAADSFFKIVLVDLDDPSEALPEAQIVGAHEST